MVDKRALINKIKFIGSDSNEEWIMVNLGRANI